MTSHRSVRINLNLPELTPSQVESLWNFLEDLASAVWNEYENELLDGQHAPFSEDDDPDGYDDATVNNNSVLFKPIARNKSDIEF